MQLGNGKWESTTFNSRLQPIQIALGTVQNGTDKLKLDYTYGTTNNNGNVQSQTITTPTTGNTTGFTAIQTYNYDELNRLKSAEEKIANTTSWKQTYTFDRYGNRRFDTGTDTNGEKTTTLAPNCATAVCNPTIDPATNKLIGYTFDTAGNTEVDANGQTFTYDGENKQIKVKDTNGNTIGEYFFDGDGKRVKKLIPNTGETTIFVYDASARMVGEYSTNTPQTPKVSYLTSDHLGSRRITTDKDGEVYTRRDFMPFGEEINAIHTSQRTATLNYATDEIRQKFTTYERDQETELDFAQARMHNYNHGRFTSPDPLMASAVTTVAQSWNRYSYALNNPLKYVDPTGEAFKDLTDEQVRVFQTYVDKQNEGRETALSAEEVYNGLSESQQTTFESVTHALENTNLTDKKGNPITDKDGKPLNALNLVEGVTQITGQLGDDPKAGKGGKRQFRLLLDLQEGAVDTLAESKQFKKAGLFDGKGHIYKDGEVKDASNLRQKGKGAKLQISYDKNNKLEADIDVDYRSKRNVIAHNKPSNSDVRSGENLRRHNERYGKENPLRNIPQKK